MNGYDVIPPLEESSRREVPVDHVEATPAPYSCQRTINDNLWSIVPKEFYCPHDDVVYGDLPSLRITGDSSVPERHRVGAQGEVSLRGSDFHAISSQALP